MSAEKMAAQESPTTLGELQRYTEDGREAFVATFEAVTVTAGDIERAVANYGIQKLGMSRHRARLLGRQVVRPLRHVADLQIEAAKAMQATYGRARMVLGQVDEQGRPKGSGPVFDPEK